MASIAFGIGATAVIVLVAAMTSPEWSAPDRFKIARVQVMAPQPRSALGISLFGVVVGVPAACGLLGGSFLVGPGALAAIFLGRRLLAESQIGAASEGTFISRVASRPESWFVVIFWSILALYVRLETTGLGPAAAAQAALGPALLQRPVAGSVGVGIALFSGLLATVMWIERLPAWNGSGAPPLVRWGESAVAPALIAATAVGPSLSEVSRGPIEVSSFAAAAISFAVTLMCVGGVSFVRRYAHRIPAEPALFASAAMALFSIAICSAASR